MVIGDIEQALKGADACRAFSRLDPSTPAWVSAMARDTIVFACANPAPEIWPLARLTLDPETLHRRATQTVLTVRESTGVLMREGLIAAPPATS